MTSRPTDAASLAELLVRRARERPHDVVLVDPAGHRWTYGQLDHAARVAAGLLAGWGVGKGDRVASLCANRLSFFGAAFGSWLLGAVFVPLSVEQRGSILVQMLRNADPTVVLVDEAGEAALSSTGEHRSVLEGRLRSVREIEGNAGPFAWPPSFAADAPALIMYSSGTTGVSKGCVLSHGYMVLAGRDFRRAVEMRSDDFLYSSGPFSHLNAWWAFAGALQGGVPLAFETRFSASRFWSRAAEVGATLFDYVGSMIAITLRRDEGPGPECRLRAGIGGAARPDEVRAFGERFGIPLLECYGLTECCLPTYQTEAELRIGSIGRLADCVEARLVDEAGGDVPAGSRGELLLRAVDSRAMFSGYWRRSDLTEAAFTGPWFRTGDICSRDADGYFFYVDRKRHFIRRRGENISAFEVEGIVFDHPCVANCAVIGVPSPLGEEDVLLAVQPKAGRAVDPRELLAWCRERMASFMVPRYVRVMDRLPLTPSERVEKQKLRDQGITADVFDREDDERQRS